MAEWVAPPPKHCAISGGFETSHQFPVSRTSSDGIQDEVNPPPPEHHLSHHPSRPWPHQDVDQVSRKDQSNERNSSRGGSSEKRMKCAKAQVFDLLL